MTYVVYISQMTEIGLAKWDDKNNIIPDLATDIPSVANGGVSADGLTITWHLRPNLKWSDGQPLTSKDVAFTEQVLVDPKDAGYTVRVMIKSRALILLTIKLLCFISSHPTQLGKPCLLRV